jgi:hypothetical protein
LFTYLFLAYVLLILVFVLALVRFWYCVLWYSRVWLKWMEFFERICYVSSMIFTVCETKETPLNKENASPFSIYHHFKSYAFILFSILIFSFLHPLNVLIIPLSWGCLFLLINIQIIGGCG